MSYVQYLQKRLRAAAARSSCPRSAVGALLVCELTGVVLVEAHNAPETPCAALCGADGRTCTRDALHIPSGTRNDIGCLHAEFVLVRTAWARGMRVQGRHVWVSRTPCEQCCSLLLREGVSAITITERPAPHLMPPLWRLVRAGVRIYTKG